MNPPSVSEKTIAQRAKGKGDAAERKRRVVDSDYSLPQ